MGKIAGIRGPGHIQTKQLRIAQMARINPERVLTSLSHNVDIHWLYEAWCRIRKKGAAGVDEVTAKEYEENLTENLKRLLELYKSGKYRAPNIKRAEIPKADGKTRVLGITTTEDKILQMAVKMLLEPIYEQDFLDCSYGFRPMKSQHMALEDLRKRLTGCGGSRVLEVDIKGFFDHIPHAALRGILDQRMRDGLIRRSIDKWLKAGIQSDGIVTIPSEGTPQGSIMSPLLANIYLHEVVDRWFHDTIVPETRGTARMFRFADDIIMVFAFRSDAERTLEVLKERMAKFGLCLHPEKTRLVHFRPPRGRKARKKRVGDLNRFGFLGFDFYWDRSREGVWVVKQKTQKERLSRKLREIGEWCRKNRHMKIHEQHRILSAKLRGHYQYFGVIGNSRMLQKYFDGVKRTWCKWLLRRSQRSGLTWKKFYDDLTRNPLPRPKIVHSARRSQQTPKLRSRMS